MIASIQSLIDRVRLIVGRCVIVASRYDAGAHVADVELTAGEKRRGLDFVQQFGLVSRPKGEVSGVALFVGGNRANGVVVACNGEESALRKSLKEGEVYLVAPFGQQIFLKEDGSILFKSANGVVNVDGEMRVSEDVIVFDKKPNQVRVSTHIHGSGAGPTSPPKPGS